MSVGVWYKGGFTYYTAPICIFGSIELGKWGSRYCVLWIFADFYSCED
jgi:hypothetical protein